MLTALPDPGQLTPDGHAQISRRFLAQARIHLEEHDRLQAGEKIWGAAAHALKAIGEQRGWDHDGHVNVIDIAEHLGREFGLAVAFNRYLACAEYVHKNFYNNKRSESSIRLALDDVETLVNELAIIRNSPPRPYTVTDNGDRIRLGRLLGLRRSERPAIGDHSPVGYSLTHGDDKDDKEGIRC